MFGRRGLQLRAYKSVLLTVRRNSHGAPQTENVTFQEKNAEKPPRAFRENCHRLFILWRNDDFPSCVSRVWLLQRDTRAKIR